MQDSPAAILAEILPIAPTNTSDPDESLFGPIKLDRETVRGRLRPTVRDHVGPRRIWQERLNPVLHRQVGHPAKFPIVVGHQYRTQAERM